jgi:hypothetical protein
MVPPVPTTLPPFTADGLLPPGDYELSLAELARSMLVGGPAARAPTWDAAWRAQLVANLAVLVRQLWAVGIDQIFADGSFVEDKDHPNDIDGYFECPRERLASGKLVRALNVSNPKRSWTWDPARRRPYRGYPKRQLPMWHAYRVELYPHFGQPAGLRDEHGHELTFPSAFRRSRSDGRPRGLVKIRKETTP